MKRKTDGFLRACSITGLLLFAPAMAGAAVLDIQNSTFVFRDFRGENPFSSIALGDRLVFSAKVNVNGSPPSPGNVPEVTRQSPSSAPISLPFFPSPAIPNEFAQTVQFDASLASVPWTFRAALGLDSIQRTVPALPASVVGSPIGLARGATVDGNGDVSWTAPTHPDINRLTVDIISGPNGIQLPDGTAVAPGRIIAQARVNGTSLPTSFNLAQIGDPAIFGNNPTGYVPSINDQFVIRLRHELRDFNRVAPEDGDSIGSQVSRSSTFISVTVLPPGTPEVFLPTVNTDGEFLFDVDVTSGVTYLFDPEIAIGFDYFIDSGPNFASVSIPDPLSGGDDMFDLFLPGLIDPISLVAGTPFDLTTIDPLGFSSFRIAGIDPAEALDPNDPLAFVTGLGFVDSGQVAVRMVPITTFVAEPPAALLLAISMTALACARCAPGRRRGSPV